VVPVIQEMIKMNNQLGPKYIIPPPFDMEASFSDASNKSPIIIVLSPGADPMAELQKIANLKDKRISSISLGQGQGEIAKAKIREAQEAQQWVVLQNCHLCPSFLPTLDALIEEIEY